jgi:hypothetical protein
MPRLPFKPNLTDTAAGVVIDLPKLKGIPEFDVLRREKITDKWKVVGKKAVSPSWTDTTVELGKTYMYRVTNHGGPKENSGPRTDITVTNLKVKLGGQVKPVAIPTGGTPSVPNPNPDPVKFPPVFSAIANISTVQSTTAVTRTVTVTSTNGAITVAVDAQPAGGTLRFDGTTLSYVPNTYVGTTSIGLKATDAIGLTATYSIAVVVLAAVNPPPPPDPEDPNPPVVTRPRINVKNSPYNAIGDGVNDDTAEIQLALTAAGTGYDVYFPAGNYKTSAQVTLNAKTDVRLVGDNRDTTRIFTVDMVEPTAVGSTRDVLKINNCHNCEVVGLDIDGNNATTVFDPLDISGGKAIRVTDCWVSNVVRDNHYGRSQYGGYGCSIYGVIGANWSEASVFERVGFRNIGWAKYAGILPRPTNWRPKNADGGQGLKPENCKYIYILDCFFVKCFRGAILPKDCQYIIADGNSGQEIGNQFNYELLSEECFHGSDVTFLNGTFPGWSSSDGSDRYMVIGQTLDGTGRPARPAIGFELLANGNDDGMVFDSTAKCVEHGATLSNTSRKRFASFVQGRSEDCSKTGAYIEPHTGGAEYIYYGNWTFKDCKDPSIYANFNSTGAAVQTLKSLTVNGCVFSRTTALPQSQSGIAFNGNIKVVGFTAVNNTFNARYRKSIEVGANVTETFFARNTSTGNQDNTFPASTLTGVDIPAFTIGGPDTATVGVAVTFTFAVTTTPLNIGVLHTHGGMGDRSNMYVPTGTSVTHTYRRAGTYTMCFVVWDNNGRANHATKTVVVS